MCRGREGCQPQAAAPQPGHAFARGSGSARRGAACQSEAAQGAGACPHRALARERTRRSRDRSGPAAARQRMDAASAAQRERIRIALRRAGVGHIQLRTDRDWVADIARFVLAYRRVASMLHAPPQGVSR